MKHKLSLVFAFCSALAMGQTTNPMITSWLQNTTQTGTYYVSGNSTAISNGILVNCQKVEYNANYVYITTEGIPSYPTGPFLDGNPSVAAAQSSKFAFPLNPQPNTGTPTATTMGTIGVFINGVSLFDYQDGVGWNPSTNNLCGGPTGSMCTGTVEWHRDAIPAEMSGFDCSKAHPANGQYHHHQNPSAFKYDLQLVSSICNLYDADGLYQIDSTAHSPLLGFAYDGYPIYGAYGYAHEDGTGGIVRLKSSYQLRNITTRTNGPNVNQTITITTPNGPTSETLFLGYFREDYEYVQHAEEDYLDEHNGRQCVTPEFPNGTYAYFCTVDENWNSAYPYGVGPTFYGVYANRSVNTIPAGTTVYTSSVGLEEGVLNELNLNFFPNPATDFIAVQVKGLLRADIDMELVDMGGRIVRTGKINAGQTLAYLDLQTVYPGMYILRMTSGGESRVERVEVVK